VDCQHGQERAGVHQRQRQNQPRLFCYIANVLQANLLAAIMPKLEAFNEVYNIAVRGRTFLNELYAQLKKNLTSSCPHMKDAQPVYREFRVWDVLHIGQN